MEFQKIVNFLDTTFDDKDLPRFVTKNWIEVNDQSEKNYSPNKFCYNHINNGNTKNCKFTK